MSAGQAGIAVSGVLLLLAVAVFALKLTEPATSGDFKYVWLSGHLWDQGQNPYTDVFEAAGQRLFDGNRPQYWAYPPNWWPVSVTLAQWPFEAIAPLWRWMNGAFILAGIAVATLAVRQLQPLAAWRIMVFAAVTLTMSATTITLALGQTSALMFLGTSLCLLALVRGSTVLMVVALVIVGLKPTFGIVFVALLLPHRRWWSSLALAAVITILAMMPVFWDSGVRPVIDGLLSRLRLYGTQPANFADSTTGLRHLIYRINGLDIPSLLPTAILSIGLAGAGFIRPGLLDVKSLPALFMAFLAGLVTFVQLHSYDAIILSIPILLCAGFSVPAQIGVFLVTGLLYQANVLAETLGLDVDTWTYFPGSTVVTGAALCLMGVALAVVFRRMERTGTDGI